MKVAFASSDGVNIDSHFGSAGAFYVWDIQPSEARFEVAIGVDSDGEQEDKIASRIALLEGCRIAYSMQIGGPAAAKLVAKRIHPMKTGKETPIGEIVTSLQQVLNNRPPPWLGKILKGEG